LPIRSNGSDFGFMWFSFYETVCVGMCPVLCQWLCLYYYHSCADAPHIIVLTMRVYGSSKHIATSVNEMLPQRAGCCSWKHEYFINLLWQKYVTGLTFVVSMFLLEIKYYYFSNPLLCNLLFECFGSSALVWHIGI